MKKKISGISLDPVSKWSTTCSLLSISRSSKMAIKEVTFWKSPLSTNSKNLGFSELILCPVFSAAAKRNSLIVLVPPSSVPFRDPERAWASSNPSLGMLGMLGGMLGMLGFSSGNSSLLWIPCKDAGTTLASSNPNFSLGYWLASLCLVGNFAVIWGPDLRNFVSVFVSETDSCRVLVLSSLLIFWSSGWTKTVCCLRNTSVVSFTRLWISTLFLITRFSS